jgi:NAD(P)-dependent dehydrogenase (short-subunit alcohol dehydrogenase family)
MSFVVAFLTLPVISDSQVTGVDFLEADVSDHSALQEALDLVKDKYGYVDILINNAAVMPGWLPCQIVSY